MPLKPEKFGRFVRLFTAAVSTRRYRPTACAPPRSPRSPPPCRSCARVPVGAPIGIEYVRLPVIVTWSVVRALLRLTPPGRSLKIESSLSSNPVVTLYGVPVLPPSVSDALRFFSACEFRAIWYRCRRSPGEGPHSAASVPLGG